MEVVAPAYDSGQGLGIFGVPAMQVPVQAVHYDAGYDVQTLGGFGGDNTAEVEHHVVEEHGTAGWGEEPGTQW